MNERRPGHAADRERVSPQRPAGSFGRMGDEEIRRGPHAEEKLGPPDDDGRPQPSESEVESARLLANDARDALRVRGLTEEEIRRFADEYVALDIGQDTDAFILWAIEHRRTAD